VDILRSSSYYDYKTAISKFADLLRFVLTGALAGLALFDTLTAIMKETPSTNWESASMVAGAIAFAAIVKFLRIA